MSARLLITGFEAFQGETLNPSELLLQSLPKNSDIDTLLLPVSFAKGFQSLQDFCAGKNYAMILMLGQAGGRSKISLERIAINWRESASADNEGFVASPGAVISLESEQAFFSRLPLEKMKVALSELEIPAEISFSAGAYVCNDLFFRVAEFFHGKKTRVGFIHVPYLPEQVVNKPGTPSLDLATMEKALAALISCAQSEIND